MLRNPIFCDFSGGGGGFGPPVPPLDPHMGLLVDDIYFTSDSVIVVLGVPRVGQLSVIVAFAGRAHLFKKLNHPIILNDRGNYLQHENMFRLATYLIPYSF